MKSEVKNSNLWVAERILAGIHAKPYLSPFRSGVILETEDITELSSEQLVNALKRLEGRDLLGFEDEEDKYDTNFHGYIKLYFKGEGSHKLEAFINQAKDKFYGLLSEYKKRKELDFVLEALSVILDKKYLDDSKIDFSEIGQRYIKVLEWIADYSGALTIWYDDVPDVEWEKDMKRPRVLGVYPEPKSVLISDRKTIEDLQENLQQFVLMPQKKRVELFLKNHQSVDWKCARCNRWFEIKLDDQKKVIGYLADFQLHKFKTCYDCRKRNYFSIDHRGEIKFSITKKKTFSELKREEEKQKMQRYQEAIQLSAALRKQQEKD